MTRSFIILFFLFAGEIIAQKKDETFSIIAFGDMPYSLPGDYARFENLIKVVNNENQIFNVHVGDIKSSKTACSEEYFSKIYNYFEEFKKPLIYTPGDNEWTDCDRPAAGGYDPEERLEVIRKTFFKTNSSFGKEKLTLIAQSENPSFAKFVENKRWDFNRVAFGTVHLVGSDNNFLPNSKNFNKEFYERDKANLAWLNEIFVHAKKENSAGIILFTQADMFKPDKGIIGFENILKELRKLVIDFKRPVVLVNGDSHHFVVDKPFIDKATERSFNNFTRIQVFGEADINAVKIIVNPASPNFFQVEQLIIEGN
jgi:hypothetical protein